ncbi:MAG TPA: glutathione peroxidase [Nitrobacter sp.]|nr:glutathione peroxidase [Nitrobacter sp.]
MSIYDIDIASLDGEPLDLHQYKGKAVLVVNVASKCGLTPQYTGLENLQKRYADRDFTVLGVPCNQFGGQEPGAEPEILDFCTANYGVTFPLFAKIDVNGDNAHPLYKYLKREKSGLLGASIKWNFTKFLVGRQGNVVARHAPTTKPKTLTQEIEALL